MLTSESFRPVDWGANIFKDLNERLMNDTVGHLRSRNVPLEGRRASVKIEVSVGRIEAALCAATWWMKLGWVWEGGTDGRCLESSPHRELLDATFA